MQAVRRLHAEQARVRRRDADRPAAVAAGARPGTGPPRPPRPTRPTIHPACASGSHGLRVTPCSGVLVKLDGAELGRGGEPGEDRAGGAQAPRPRTSSTSRIAVGVDERRVRCAGQPFDRPRAPSRRSGTPASGPGSSPRGDRRVDGRRLPRAPVGVEEAHRVQRRGSSVDAREALVEHASTARQLAAPDRVGEVPRVARPERCARSGASLRGRSDRARRASVAGGRRLAPESPVAPRRGVAQLRERRRRCRPRGSSRSGNASRSASSPRCSCPQYDRIAMPRLRFRDSGTIGYASSISAPMQ